MNKDRKPHTHEKSCKKRADINKESYLQFGQSPGPTILQNCLSFASHKQKSDLVVSCRPSKDTTVSLEPALLKQGAGPEPHK